ncbi:PaaI family thioesterase [Glutamicibacter sp. NPDC090743]|uniref:PaaI family thioesterase n=1 Tax=Glutamicibacter sp. NPDC090743 TaxID=3364001 RepID=UPI0037F84174
MTRQVALPDGGTQVRAAGGEKLLDAAGQVRELLDAMVRLPVDTEVAQELGERLDGVLELLRGAVIEEQDMVLDPFGERGEDYMDRSPVSGVLNPIAPPISMRMDGPNRVRTTTRLGLPYQGPPGRVHGGWVATLLDHLMGYAAGTVAQWIFTRSLTVDYDHAVPLFEQLELSAWVEEIDGRKIWVRGQIEAGGQVVAQARGLWVPPRESQPEQS